MCAFMASGGIGFFSSVSVYNGFGLRNKLRDGPLHNEKARGIFFSPFQALVTQFSKSRFGKGVLFHQTRRSNFHVTKRTPSEELPKGLISLRAIRPVRDCSGGRVPDKSMSSANIAL